MAHEIAPARNFVTGPTFFFHLGPTVLCDGSSSQTREEGHASEGYALEDVGRQRVFAVADRCHPVNPQLDLPTVPTRSLRGLDLGDAVFLCPGGHAATDALAESIGDTIAFAARCTVGWSTICVDMAWDRRSLARWPKGMQTAHSATSKSVPAEATVAGLAVAEFVRFVGGRRPRSLRLNLLTLKLDVVR